jgi:hypothetical protein
MARSNARPPKGVSPLQDGAEPNRKEAAEYIATLLEGLRLVAHQAHLLFLSYLLSVALEEANIEKSERG